MLSAPSTSIDSSLPSAPATPSTGGATAATGQPATPFAAVLNGLTATPASPTVPAPAAAAVPLPPAPSATGAMPATPTPGGPGPVPAWLQPAPTGADVVDGSAELPAEGRPEEAEADDEPLPLRTDPSVPPESNVAATMVAWLVAPVSAPPPPAATANIQAVNTDSTKSAGAERAGFADEDFEGALPESPGALYPAAAAAIRREASGAEPARAPGAAPASTPAAAMIAAEGAARPRDARTPHTAAERGETTGADPAGPDSAAASGDALPATAAPAASLPDEYAALRRPDRFFRPPPAPSAQASVAAAPSARIAGPAPAPAATPDAAEGGEMEKLTQDVVAKVVHPALQVLGIDPAKVRSTMEIVAPDFSSLAPDHAASEAEPELAAASTRALERVIQVTDTARPTERSAVNVRLDFGESGPLSVHITMREGRVHTLFRSDSADVRDTLSNAWTQFVQKGEHGALPLAEPVMLPLRATTSSPSGEAGRFADSFNQPGSDGHANRQPGATRDETGAPLGQGLRRRASGPAAVAAPAASRGHGSSHLSALA